MPHFRPPCLILAFWNALILIFFIPLNLSFHKLYAGRPTTWHGSYISTVCTWFNSSYCQWTPYSHIPFSWTLVHSALDLFSHNIATNHNPVTRAGIQHESCFLSLTSNNPPFKYFLLHNSSFLTFSWYFLFFNSPNYPILSCPSRGWNKIGGNWVVILCLGILVLKLMWCFRRMLV